MVTLSGCNVTFALYTESKCGRTNANATAKPTTTKLRTWAKSLLMTTFWRHQVWSRSFFHFGDMQMRLHLTVVVMATDPCQSFIHQASSFGSFCSPSQCHILGCERALDLMFSTSVGSDSWPVPLSPAQASLLGSVFLYIRGHFTFVESSQLPDPRHHAGMAFSVTSRQGLRQ